MELLIQAKKINIEYGGRELFNIDKLELYSHDRIGLVGDNGVGKSTLMQILLGKRIPIGCQIKSFGQFAYIPQLDCVIEKEINNYAILGKLDVKDLDLSQSSGGEETRLKIAQAFSEQMSGIFADEPTSHLDQTGINFLIEQMKFFSGALLIISHNRQFLDAVVNKTWELKDGKITEYWGNYTDYLEQKDEIQKKQAAQYQQFVTERERLEQAAEAKRKQGQKIIKKAKETTKKTMTERGGRLAHQKTVGSKQKTLFNAAKSIEHRIATMKTVDAPETARMIHFRQSKALEIHNPYPIIGTDINISFGEKVLLKDASFQIPLGAKVAFTGDNGTGKTSLFQMILNGEPAISISPKAKIGYFSQDSYQYQKEKNIMTFIQENSDYQQAEIGSALELIGFSQANWKKKLTVLSGGEIIKLHLAKLLLGQYNILLLDEPNNFLDTSSIEALEMMIKNYSGTILFISHDQKLIENIATHIYQIQNKKLILK